MADSDSILGRLEELAGKHTELEKLLSDPDVVADQQKYREITRDYKNSEKMMAAYTAYKSLLAQIADDREIIESGSDEELAEIARTELEDLEQEREKQEEAVKLLLLPRDANDDKNVIVEIRAGTGGEEAGLFVADVYRMYTRYAEGQRWKIENMSSNPTGIGGFKEIIFMVSGSEVYRRLKFESGVHRVQRVPETESGGRIHTSAISVAIMPEAEEVDVEINQNELKIDVYRSSGPGGQSVNTTDSAVRITHLPTGLVVTCQDEKSQHKNRAKAMKILSTRLYDKIRSEQNQARAQNRKLQVGSGDRSEKIRTYNYPQNRITDHRIHYTSHDLDKVMEGELDTLLDALLLSYQNELLAAGTEG